MPWCRWRLHSAPLGLGEPRWADYPAFDITDHIVALTGHDEETSYARFEALLFDVLSQSLDASRPLWQICLIPRLEDGRLAVVGKIHHGLVDGMAALQVVALLI